MKRNLTELANKDFDVVIVGGGAFGACAAWDAASRGLSVALVDKGDFCNATSANHLKVVHGGIRYLQHLDVARVRESCRERSALLRIAPHLVRPLPIMMPAYGYGIDGRAVLGAGFLLYDLLTLGRNAGIKDENHRIPPGRTFSRERALGRYPGLSKDGLTGAGIFFDAQYYNPPRLVLAFLQSAIARGACVANYVSVTGFLRRNSCVCGVEVRDYFTGDQFPVRGRTVLNAAGPWAAGLLVDALDIRLRPQPAFSRDAGFVVRGQRTGTQAIACRVQTTDPDAVLSRKGRHVMVIPWRNHTLFGSWHTVHTRTTEDIGVGEEELQSFIDEINASDIDLGIRREDVSMVYSGLTLFGQNDPGQRNLRFGHRSILIDHAAEHGIDGLVTLIGVRATTARGKGEAAIDLILRKTGKAGPPSRTAETSIHGGDFEDFEQLVSQVSKEYDARLRPADVRALVHNHGTDYRAVLEHGTTNPALLKPLGETNTLVAEVVHAVRNEMAMTLSDVVFRRTDLGTAGNPGDDVINRCAGLMAEELGWNSQRVAQELDAVHDRFP